MSFRAELVNFVTFSVFFSFFGNRVWLNLYDRAFSRNETSIVTCSFYFYLYEDVRARLYSIYIHHLKSSPTFSVRPRSSVGRVTVDLIRRSWVRFPPRSKDFFFASCGSLIPFARANAQWVIHGFK